MKNKTVKENELYDTKWFDYRMLRPHACDLYFLYHYAEENALHNEIVGKSYFKSFLNKVDLNKYESWRFRGFITRTRQFADKHGMPYYYYCKYHFKAIRDYGYKYDSINVLSNKRVRNIVYNMFDTYSVENTIYSRSKIFSVELYRKLDIQNKYFDYLTKRIVVKYAGCYEKISSVLYRMIADKQIPEAYVVENIKRIIVEVLNG